MNHDPAVAYLNRMAGDSTPYREGFSGNGEDILHFVEAGTGPTVVFVHGFPSFWFGWFKQMEALRGQYRVVAIDAPGAGFSPRPHGWDGFSVERLAKRLGAFIAEIAPGEKITLVGHDWGGSLVWAYAEHDASLLERLVVLSAPPYSLFIELAAIDPEQQRRSEYMPRISAMDYDMLEQADFPATLHARSYGALAERGILTKDQSELFRKALTLDAVDRGIEWYRTNMPPFEAMDADRDAWPAHDARGDCPVLLIEGSEDKTFVDDLYERARSHAASLEYAKLDGVEHWTPLEGAEQVNELLRRFIRDSSSREDG